MPKKRFPIDVYKRQGLDQLSLEPVDGAAEINTVGMVTILTLKFTDGTSQEIRYSGSYLVTGDKKYKMAEKNEAALNAVFYQAYAKKLKSDGYESTPLGRCLLYTSRCV